MLINYQWPGNVRQLRNAVEKMVIFCREREIGYEETISSLELTPESQQSNRNKDNGDDQSLKHAIHNFERNYILMMLQKNEGKISATARALGIDRSNLFKKMRKYKTVGLNMSAFLGTERWPSTKDITG